jgi:broad specificity phosphatase PhoE
VKFLLARHGETEWNRDGRMQGRHGGKLTEKGVAQAHVLGRAARKLGVHRVVTSTLARAVETARIVADAAGCAFHACDALVETNFGECSGLTEAEIDAGFPRLRAERAKDKWRHRWPGGESYADMAERVWQAGPLIREADTLVVAHQSMNRVIAHIFAPAAVADVLRMAQPSDVLLGLDGSGSARHAQLVASDALDWHGGLYFGGVARLN